MHNDSRQGIPSAHPALARWLAFHFYYHGRQDSHLEHLLRPLVASLLRQREINSFFFVRSLLGGPHVRLRLRPLGTRETGTREAVAEAVEGAAQQFFSTFPSLEIMAKEEIRRINHGILESDPSELDVSIYPDNSVWESPFHPPRSSATATRRGGAYRRTLSCSRFAARSDERRGWVWRRQARKEGRGAARR